MFGQEQKGIAALTVVLIAVVSTGVGVAAPVVVDALDVDPDSPLYGLERLGERIRMVGDEDQMMERWGEYARLVARGKGLEYRHILDEFTEKLQRVVPENQEVRQEIAGWMQNQMPEMVRVRIRLAKNLCQRLRENMPELENILADLGNIEDLPVADNEAMENLRARLSLIAEEIREIAGKYENQLKEEITEYLEIENLVVDIDVKVDVRIRILPPLRPPTGAEFENELEKFNASLAEIEAMLQGAPENALGRTAAERLVEVADNLRDKALEAYGENRVLAALGLIHSAQVHLQRAKMILEHASEWEARFQDQWSNWKEAWENVRQGWEEVWDNFRPVENAPPGQLQPFLHSFGKPSEPLTQQWREMWQERFRERRRVQRFGD